MPIYTRNLVREAIEFDSKEIDASLNDEVARLYKINNSLSACPLSAANCTADEFHRASKVLQPANFSLMTFLHAIRTMLGSRGDAPGEVYRQFLLTCCVTAKELGVDVQSATFTTACSVAAQSMRERGIDLVAGEYSTDNDRGEKTLLSEDQPKAVAPPVMDQTAPNVDPEPSTNHRRLSARSVSMSLQKVRADSACLRPMPAQANCFTACSSSSDAGATGDVYGAHPFTIEAQNILLRHRMRANMIAMAKIPDDPEDVKRRRKACSATLQSVRSTSVREGFLHRFLPLVVREKCQGRTDPVPLFK
jgi:hypothetical protein